MGKAIILSVFVVFISIISFSRENDPPKKDDDFKPKSRDHLGDDEFYAAFTTGYSNIEKEKAFIYGGRFEYLVNHWFAIGVGGMGFFDFSHYDKIIQEHYILKGGYGGLYVEPILNSESSLYLSFPLLLGWGQLITDDWEVPSFFIAEPAAELTLKAGDSCGFTFGTSYKFVTYFLSESDPLSTDFLGDWSYTFTFKLFF